MKITIKHSQDSIDPGATCNDKQFEAVIDSLESEYLREIEKEFPEAEVTFERGHYCGKSIIVEHGLSCMADPSEEEDELQRICELVYETGNFWLHPE